MSDRRGPNDYTPHNYWLKTYPGMQSWPDEDGDWSDDPDKVREWVRERIMYGTKAIPLTLSRDKTIEECRYKSSPLYKLFPDWMYWKENEGQIYLKRGKDEWLIYTDDVFSTYEIIMSIQKEIMESLI